jgi:hypothetical protein
MGRAVLWSGVFCVAPLRIAPLSPSLIEPPRQIGCGRLRHALATEDNGIGARVPNLPLAGLFALLNLVAVALHFVILHFNSARIAEDERRVSVNNGQRILTIRICVLVGSTPLGRANFSKNTMPCGNRRSAVPNKRWQNKR